MHVYVIYADICVGYTNSSIESSKDYTCNTTRVQTKLRDVCMEEFISKPTKHLYSQIDTIE
jgi:hypothetical protein